MRGRIGLAVVTGLLALPVSAAQGAHASFTARAEQADRDYNAYGADRLRVSCRMSGPKRAICQGAAYAVWTVGGEPRWAHWTDKVIQRHHRLLVIPGEARL